MSLSSFSLAELQRVIDEAVHEAFKKHFGPRLSQPATQLVTQPNIQKASPPAPPAPPAPLQQVTQISTEPVTQQAMQQEKECPKSGNMEKVAERPVTSNSSVAMEKNRARLYRASPADLRRLRTGRQSTGNPKAAIQGFQLFFCTGVPPLASPLGCIRSAEDMEATGQG